MSQHLYWHAPLWEVLLASLAALAMLAWLMRRALRRPDIGAALSSIDPALERHPLFFFDGAHGVRPLNDAARHVLAGGGDEDRPEGPGDGPLIETLLTAYEGARVARCEDWPDEGDVLIATPVSTAGGTVTGVLAVVSSESLSPPMVRLEDAGIGADADAWLAMGASLWLHRTRPVARVLRQADGSGSGGTSLWLESNLSHNEERLLRHLLEREGEVQPSEALFAFVWPDEEVDRLGLRPDQKDRLRRLVFQLRQRVEPETGKPRYVCTAHGVGYVLYREPQPAEE